MRLDRVVDSVKEATRKFRPVVLRLEDRLVPGETLGATMPWLSGMWADLLRQDSTPAIRSDSPSASLRTGGGDSGTDAASVRVSQAPAADWANQPVQTIGASHTDAADAVFTSADLTDSFTAPAPMAPASAGFAMMNEHAVTIGDSARSFAPITTGAAASQMLPATDTGFSSMDSMAAAIASSGAAASFDAGAMPNAHALKGPGPMASSPTGYSPAQIRHAYGFDKLTQTGAGITIAIVDAYNDPTIASDLQTFDAQFGLANPNLTIAYAQGSKPKTNGGWAQEISIDVEWAHAIAPGANIMLVETASNSNADLYGGVDYATTHGAQVVSMSWRGGESSGDIASNSHFNHTGVCYLASSGDTGGTVGYPSTSPYVISVGGTNLPLDSSGNLTGAETVWSGSGGGPSTIQAEPGYQTSYGITITGGKRGTPDVSYDADPNTGVSVYDSTRSNGLSGWITFGGTSIGAPQWAGLIALADQGRASPISSNNLSSAAWYNAATGSLYASNYRDITSGSAGSYNATVGYDLCTGVGSPLANNLVPYLNTH